MCHLQGDRNGHGLATVEHVTDVGGGAGGVHLARQFGQAGERALLRGLQQVALAGWQLPELMQVVVDIGNAPASRIDGGIEGNGSTRVAVPVITPSAAVSVCNDP